MKSLKRRIMSWADRLSGGRLVCTPSGLGQIGIGHPRSQRGQATVEYVLVMLIVIAMISGAVYQLNDAFRAWMNNYFGNYLTCLLETGELPITSGEGGDGGGRNQASICVEEYQKYDISNGKTTNGATGVGGQNGRQSDSGSNRARNAESRSGGGASGSDGGSGASSSGSGASGEAAARAAAQRQAALGKKSAYTGSTEVSSGALVRGSGSSEGGGRASFDGDRSFLVKGKQSSTKSAAKKQEARVQIEGTRSLRQPSFLKKRQPATIKDQEPQLSMTFGDYFRYLLIAAVVIIVIVVIGSQLARLRQELD